MELELEGKLIDILEANIMGDNSQILKLMRMMNSTPKYWILSPNVVIVGSHDDGRPLFPPGEAFENKIVLTNPKDNPSILCEYICEKCSDGCYKWEYIGTWDNNLDLLDLDLDKEYDDPVSEFRQKVKNNGIDSDKLRENTVLSADLDINEFRSKIRSSSGYSNKVDIFQYFDWYHHLKFAGKSKNKDDKPLLKASRDTTDYLYITEYKDTKEHLYQVFCTFKNIHNDYYWEFICNVNDCKPYIKREIEKHIEIEKKREMILEFQRDHQEENQSIKNSKYYWMWNYDDAGWNSGSDAGYFQLNYKQTEINNLIFNNAFTENIGHDKEDIDIILTNSSTSDVNCSSSISKRLKYIEMKQKKHGTITSQNITITGNYNYTVGISMNQTGEDDCEQTQTVIIKNSKSEKKKEKKESVFGVLHHALINLAKIIERYTRYLLDHCMDNFF